MLTATLLSLFLAAPQGPCPGGVCPNVNLSRAPSAAPVLGTGTTAARARTSSRLVLRQPGRPVLFPRLRGR